MSWDLVYNPGPPFTRVNEDGSMEAVSAQDVFGPDITVVDEPPPDDPDPTWLFVALCGGSVPLEDVRPAGAGP